ncbi:MAG: hypothetical protein AB7F96_18960 [Beijerinckiaceae bacterium]
MVKISADAPLGAFAEKVAERTGLSQQNVTHVLAMAMVVAQEAAKEPKNSQNRPEPDATQQKRRAN